VTEAELLEAGVGRGPATGVPYAIHDELRELRELVDMIAREVAILRELAELSAAILGVELECDDCGRADGTHAVDVEH
jgi:hypothetical protein